MKDHVARLIFVVVLASAGCATSYSPVGFRGGYKDVQLAPDVFRVTFNGNGATSRERAQDFATLRASELVLQHGFSWFVIIGGYNDVKHQQYVSSGSSRTTGSIYGSGDSAYFNATTDYTPAEVYTVSKPVTQVIVRCFKEKPDDPNALNAAFLVESLKKSYGLK